MNEREKTMGTVKTEVRGLVADKLAWWAFRLDMLADRLSSDHARYPRPLDPEAQAWLDKLRNPTGSATR